MAESYTQDGEDVCASIPRGGPIYVSDMVGPLTRVSDFEASVLEQLQNIEAELSSELEAFDEDLSVDELKIITEEELVNKAFEEAFKDNEDTVLRPEASEEQRNPGCKDDGKALACGYTCSEGSGILANLLVSCEPLDGSPPRIDADGRLSTNMLTKRKRKRKERIVDQQNSLCQESYIGKVEELAKIKQKQDEDKAAARLHSFNGSRSKSNALATLSSDRTERMQALKSISSSAKVKPSNVREHAPVINPEVILCIEVYHNKKAWIKTLEFLVLGCQPLTELRDSIYCSMDELMKKGGEHDPSGYFLIEEVFCNDLRDPSASDYSRPIFDWLRNSEEEALEKWECIISGEILQKQKTVLGSASHSKLPRFRTVDMHKIRFCDLQFRLGAGYLYCHQGDCKHVFVIRDMRLIHPEDMQNRAAYPINIFQRKLYFRKCSVCRIYRAEKVTVDDKWAAENPCYFCKNCYYMLHYENGSLIYDEFSVYDYDHE